MLVEERGSSSRRRSDRDLRARIVEAAADEPPVVVDQRDHVAGTGLALDAIDGVLVDPGVPEPQRSRAALPQHDAR